MRKVLAAIALVALLVLTDVALLVWLGTAIGFWPVLGLVLVSAGLGAWLTKREGLRVLDDARTALAQGRMPEDGLVGGLLVLAGGLLLITPGLITDVLGALLLIPPTRRWTAVRLRQAFERWWQRRAAGPIAEPDHDGAVAAEVVDFGSAGGRESGFAAWGFSTGGGPFVWSSGPRPSRAQRPLDVIDVEAEEVIVEEPVVSSPKRLPTPRSC